MCPESYIDDGCSDAIEHCLLERTLAWNVISLWTVTSAAADVRRGRLLYAGSSDVRIKVDMFIIISNTFLFYIWKKLCLQHHNTDWKKQHKITWQKIYSPAVQFRNVNNYSSIYGRHCIVLQNSCMHKTPVERSHIMYTWCSCFKARLQHIPRLISMTCRIVYLAAFTQKC